MRQNMQNKYVYERCQQSTHSQNTPAQWAWIWILYTRTHTHQNRSHFDSHLVIKIASTAKNTRYKTNMSARTVAKSSPFFFSVCCSVGVFLFWFYRAWETHKTKSRYVLYAFVYTFQCSNINNDLNELQNQFAFFVCVLFQHTFQWMFRFKRCNSFIHFVRFILFDYF